MKWLLVIVAMFTLTGFSNVSAQTNDPCGCNAVLVPNVRMSNRLTSTQLAYLASITEESYNALKLDSRNRGNAIIEVVPVSVSADWNVFKEARDRYLASVEFNLSTSEAISELERNVPRARLQYWERCKTNCSLARRSGHGINSEIINQSDSAVTVRFSWTAPPTSPRYVGRVTSSFVRNGSVRGVPNNQVFRIGERFVSGEERIVNFSRTPNTEFEYGVNVSFYSTGNKIPAPSRDVWTDPNTGLMWQKLDNSRDSSWQDAFDFCENADTGGFADWRLPTIVELRSIYAPTEAQRLYRLSACCPWSSEKVSAIEAWYFDFNVTGGQPAKGNASIAPPNLRALCVRRFQ